MRKPTRVPSIPAPPGFYGCTGCRQVKPLSEFSARKKGPGGHECRCKPCRLADRDVYQADDTKAQQSLEARFWAKVDKRGPDDCWLWTAATTHGHGILWTGGKPYQKLAHVVALQLAGVEVPEGMVVDHMCRVRLCMNARHLRVVTPAINATENNDSPFSINSRRVTCLRGHSLVDDANIARRACVGPKGTVMLTRTCLTCWPSYWMWAVVKRDPPAKARTKEWRGPQTIEKHGPAVKARWLARRAAQIAA